MTRSGVRSASVQARGWAAHPGTAELQQPQEGSPVNPGASGHSWRKSTSSRPHVSTDLEAAIRNRAGWRRSAHAVGCPWQKWLRRGSSTATVTRPTSFEPKLNAFEWKRHSSMSPPRANEAAVPITLGSNTHQKHDMSLHGLSDQTNDSCEAGQYGAITPRFAGCCRVAPLTSVTTTRRSRCTTTSDVPSGASSRATAKGNRRTDCGLQVTFV
jgi:hypothetical protein